MKKIVLAGACRTAIGTMGGALSTVPAAELGSVVIKEALNRAGIPAEQVKAKLDECGMEVSSTHTGWQELKDDVIAETGLSTGKLLSSLTMLELKGIIKRLPGKRIVLSGK